MQKPKKRVFSVTAVLLAVLVAIPGAVALGVAVALVLRIREIGRGEEDDAKKY